MTLVCSGVGGIAVTMLKPVPTSASNRAPSGVGALGAQVPDDAAASFCQPRSTNAEPRSGGVVESTSLAARPGDVMHPRYHRSPQRRRQPATGSHGCDRSPVPGRSSLARGVFVPADNSRGVGGKVPVDHACEFPTEFIASRRPAHRPWPMKGGGKGGPRLRAGRNSRAASGRRPALGRCTRRHG